MVPWWTARPRSACRAQQRAQRWAPASVTRATGSVASCMAIGGGHGTAFTPRAEIYGGIVSVLPREGGGPRSRSVRCWPCPCTSEGSRQYTNRRSLYTACRQIARLGSRQPQPARTRAAALRASSRMPRASHGDLGERLALLAIPRTSSAAGTRGIPEALAWQKRSRRLVPVCATRCVA